MSRRHGREIAVDLEGAEREARARLRDVESHVARMREALDDASYATSGPGTAESVRAMAEAHAATRTVLSLRMVLVLIEADMAREASDG